MSTWSLERLLAGLHNDIQNRLATSREAIAHAPTKGDASQNVWLDLLGRYLPERYQVTTAHVVDSKDNFSDQIDVVVFDRQYTPFIFLIEGQTFIPAESVYAVFEAKQTANAAHVQYARDKVATVRKLHRTSLPIPHAGGTYPAKAPIRILGGLLAFESDWTPPLGEALRGALETGKDDRALDIGCIAAHGYFQRASGKYEIHESRKAATAFLLKLIAALQFSGTVPMIDMDAYGGWLAD
jgi:hypothetical protein